MILLQLLILLLIILKYGNPFGNLTSENRGMWNRMGMVFVGTLVFLFVAIFIKHI